MDKITLYEEFRLIERCESEINGAWKGVHLLLFFLAFVFGSFCTFCFHMLMYLFDEKCILFPKLLSLTSLRHNVIYEFIPDDKSKADKLPVDFLSAQWMEKSACYLPTYVPLISAIFGLVWTTMFLMCSTGSRTLTGLQRPWRVIHPVFVFSLAMGSLCIYTSVRTQYGLQELCMKLGEITGSSTCSYTVNVATLLYERQIRGVYQATRLTILTAWLHTACWLLSALLALVRVCLAVDFQLVRVRVDLVGNIDRMLERHEEQIQTVSPNLISYGDSATTHRISSETSLRVHFNNSKYNDNSKEDQKTEMLYFSEHGMASSELSLVPEERHKLARLAAYATVPKNMQFIVKILYDLVDNIELPQTPAVSATSLTDISDDSVVTIARQFGRENISKTSSIPPSEQDSIETHRPNYLREIHRDTLTDTNIYKTDAIPSTSRKKHSIYPESKWNLKAELKHDLEEMLKEKLDNADFEKEHHSDPESKFNLTAEMKQVLEEKLRDNLDQKSTKENKRGEKDKKNKKVKISDSAKSMFIVDEGENDQTSGPATDDKKTQTKEKQE